MEIPTATSLREIYPDDAIEEQQKRWEKLLSQFQSKYGTQAEFVARSPGRVNLIGEVSPQYSSLAQCGKGLSKSSETVAQDDVIASKKESISMNECV